MKCNDVSKLTCRLNIWKHRTIYSLYNMIVSAAFIVLSISLNTVITNEFFYYLPRVLIIYAGISMGTLIFSAMKQASYEEQVEKIKLLPNNSFYSIPEEKSVKSIDEKVIQEERVIGNCQELVSTFRTVDDNIQVHEDGNPNDIKVLGKHINKQ